MNREQAKQRIKKLSDLVNYHRYLYHVLDRQEISDSALDSLKKELFNLEKQFPDLIVSESPTQRIGGKPLDKFEKVRRKIPMLSFNDGFSEEDIKNWLERISSRLTKEEAKKIDFYCELKIDGLAVEMIYQNGILKIGSTRGDGIVGEDVTQNLKTVEAIPLKLKQGAASKETIIVRGELFISSKEFGKINREREKRGEPAYANPRNLAAGSVRQLDPKITSQRHLDFFAYDLKTDFGEKTHQEKHKILKELGFKTNSNNRYCPDLGAVFNFYKEVQKLREKLDYEIDGLVVMVDSNEIFRKLGKAGKAPRGAIAFKFPAKQAATIVEDIKVQVGRTGVLTPVAILKPVRIGGVVVSRATLHNEDEIKRLGLKIGDTVIVGRAGDVIPDIAKVLRELRTGKEKEFKMPSFCPFCGAETGRKPGEALYYCLNPKCFAVQRKYFYHFVSKPAFDIKGLGPKITDHLMENGLVSGPADLFALEEGDLVSLERFADKSAGNLIKAIQAKRKISLPRFIYGLGIRNVGEETARDLAGEFGTLENLAKAGLEDLEKIKDVGPVVAKSIYEWFLSEKNRKFLEKIRSFVEIEKIVKPAGRKDLEGKTFVLTGSLEAMSREQAKEKIRKLGGDISESVSKETDFVIVGKEPGSKYDKAKKLGIKTLNEKEFLKIIKL